PLRFEIDQARMTDERLVTRRRGLHPVRHMTAITRARRSLPRSVDKRVKPDRLVSSFVDLVCWSFEWIALNTLRKRFTESGRAGIVRQQHDVTRPREHEIV